jgi:hypothetical protein
MVSEKECGNEIISKDRMMKKLAKNPAILRTYVSDNKRVK